MSDDIHQNDSTFFEFTVKDDGNIVNLSTKQLGNVVFQAPDGNVQQHNTGLLTDGTDGIATYQASSGDLYIPGVWAYQLYFLFPSGQYYSDIARFKVQENIYLTVPGT
jgi:hypothetical protein